MVQGQRAELQPRDGTAADLVIVEAEEIVEVGEIEPENVMTPGILVNYIVLREGK